MVRLSALHTCRAGCIPVRICSGFYELRVYVSVSTLCVSILLISVSCMS